MMVLFTGETPDMVVPLRTSEEDTMGLHPLPFSELCTTLVNFSLYPPPSLVDVGDGGAEGFFPLLLGIT